MAQTTLTASKDVHMTSSTPTVNQNNVGFLDIGEDKGSVSTRRLLLQFDLATVPSRATITGATLRLYDTAADLADNDRVMSCYRCLRTWGEATATWNTYDGSSNWGTSGADNVSDREATDIGTITMPGAEVAGYVSITLTASAVQEWLTGAFTNNGLILRMATENADLHRFDSRDETNKPQLVIDYTLPNSALGFFEV